MPNKLWWLSFANPNTGRFRGVFITSANSPVKALKKAHALGACPKDPIEVEASRVSELIPMDLRDRLLLRKELKFIGESTLSA